MYTYRATNTLNGKFYIGSTKDLERRKIEHLNSKANYPFQKDLRKTPEAFIWEVYTDNLDTNEHEVRLLKEFFFDVRCYNLNSCAERPPSAKGKKRWKNELTQKQILCFEKPEGEGWEKGVLQKSIKKMSVARKGKYTGEKNPLFGVPRTEAQKKAHSEIMSGKYTGEKHPQYGKFGALSPRSKAIIAIEPDGTQRHFGGVREAARELEIAYSSLSWYLKPGHVPRGKWDGWQFFYKNP